jgi:hypothetical protein
MNINKISDVPGGIDVEVTVTFKAGSDIVTAVGSTPTAWVRHPNGTKTPATTAVVTGANTLRLKWPFNTLPDATYWLEGYLTPPAGTPGRCVKASVVVTGYLGA